MKRFIVLMLTVIGINVWGLDDLTNVPNAGPEEIRPLSCIQNLQLSIGPMGFTVVTPEMVLTDTFASYSPFEILIDGEANDTVTCNKLNQSVMVTVRDTRNGNSCWSNIRIEDKLPPVIECFNDTLPCYTDPFSVDYEIYAAAIDNCDDNVELYYSFFLNDLDCQSNRFVSYAELHWTAEDDQGMTSQCVSRVFFERLSLDDTQFPDDTLLYCPIIDTIDAGIPTIDGRPLDPLCDLVSFFTDDTIQGACSGEYRINRMWSAMDWCANRTIRDLQVISIEDTLAPLLICPDTTTIGTESASCTALYVIPPVFATDACGADSLITTTIQVDGIGVVVAGDTVELDTGFTNMVTTAQDDCGNIDSCLTVLEVVDDVAPVLICIPDLTVYVDSAGMAPEYCVEDFDHINHYFDNCGIDSIFIAKMVDNCDTTQNNRFKFCVDFCCADVGEDVMVIIKVQDVAGNMNFCMINTMVLDTIPPEIVDGPPDTTISCTVDFTDTTNTGGGITVIDNCPGELTIKITDSVDIDACKAGTVIRTFVACDPSGNTDTFVQTITVVNDFVFNDSLIVWAQDTCVETCPVDSLPETIGSQTFVMGDSCDVVEVTYTDVDVTDTTDVCQVIERTWMVKNECGDTVMLDSLQIITIKNFKPPILSGPPTDTTVVSDPDSCGAFVALPRLVGTDCSTGLNITNDCTATGDSIAMFFPVGEKTITFTATDTCGNVSTYQTIIRVIDEAGPSITCPPDTTVDCTSPTDTSVTGVPIVSDNCDSLSTGVTLTFSDSIEMGMCAQEMTILRTFTATDSSGNVSTCLQTINVQDTTAPILNCPADITISCEESTDSDNTGEPTFSDNCDPSLIDSLTQMDSVVNGSCDPEQTIFRTWRISDDCGNSTSCVQMITVIDTTPPMIDCPPGIAVECSEQTDPTVTGEPVVSDNCDPMPTFMFQDSIIPGRGQTLRTIIRRWTVSDDCGNTASCLQEILVRDTVPPTIICPPDITVGCDTSLADLSIFGEPDTSDNCLGIILTRDTIYDLDLCNVGTITRKFFAEDSVGNIDSCIQIITVEQTDSLEEGDIIWPDSVITVDACLGISPDSAAVGMPVIDSSMAGCFKVSITFSDSIDYNCMPGVCTTLVRKWTVIDSCQLDTLGGGVFCFDQMISVIDTTKPVITDLVMNDTVYLHPDSTCDAFFRIVADAFDCSGIKSITNNSMFGVDSLRNASGRYPRGLTPIRFIAEDSCCNADTQFVFIYVLDTIPPSITCQDARLRIRGELGTEMAEVCVSDLIVTAMDNCDPRIDLRASFDPNDPSDTCRVYNCDSLMMQPMLMRNLTIYITDGSNNTSTCVSKVTVVDDLGICGGSIIGGSVQNMLGEGIEEAMVTLMEDDIDEMTDEYGEYAFPEMDNGLSYHVQVSKQDEAINGISMRDVIMIQRHLLGKEEFTLPYQFLAADLNASNSVEVGDIVRLRRLILGLIDDFEYVPDWYFIYNDFAFEDYVHPLEEEKAFEYFIDTLTSDMSLDFIGVKPGDIDGSARVSGLNSNLTRDHEVLDCCMSMGETEEIIRLTFESDQLIEGVYLNLDYDIGNPIIDVRVFDDSSDQYEILWSNEDGRLQILWNSRDELIREVRLDIEFLNQPDEKEMIRAAEEGLVSHVVDQSLTEYQVCFINCLDQKASGKEEFQNLILKQNRPNPFSASTMIEYFVPKYDLVQLQVWNSEGKLVLTKEYEVDRGWHIITLDKDVLGNGGVYNYRLVGNTGNATHRMLLIE